MSKKDIIIKALEEAGLSDVELIKESEGMTLVRFFYDFDEDELGAAQSFADSEAAEGSIDDVPAEEQDDETAPEEMLSEIDQEAGVTQTLEQMDEVAQDAAVTDTLTELNKDQELVEAEEDEGYEEEDEYYSDSRLQYLSEIAIDQVGEILEELQDDLDMEVQYVGYDLDEEDTESYEFVALIFEKGKALNIEELLDELEI